MRSYTETLTLLQRMTKISSQDTTNNALLAGLYNDSVRTVCNIRGGKWWFLQATKDIATIASTSEYPIPARIRKITDLYVTVGTTVYRPQPIYDADSWSRILSAQLAADDRPEFYYIKGNKVALAPSSSSTAGTITVTGRLDVRDSGIADVTSSTVTSITSGATAIVINSGGLASWAGKYIRITNTGAANTGDGFWYEIASATSTTVTLVAPYEGTTISAGSAACIVGDMTPIPESYDMAPVYRTAALFSQINDPLHPAISMAYWKLYDGGQEAGQSNMVGGILGQMLENEGASIENSYLSPDSRMNTDPNYPPRDASGFS